MADGTPAISRVQAGEDTLFELLQDTDKRLTELERRANVLATTVAAIGVMTEDDLPTDPFPDTVAWVITTDTLYVPGAGGGSGPSGQWSPGGSWPV